MKKLLIGLMLALMSFSCATIQTKTTQRYAHLTAEKIRDTCDTENRWWMHVVGTSTVVLQFDSCLGVNNMLVMITPVDQYTPEIRRYSCKLLGLHYVEFLNNTKTDKAWSLEQIKEFIMPADASTDEPAKWILIYKVNSSPLECSGPTCKVKK